MSWFGFVTSGARAKFVGFALISVKHGDPPAEALPGLRAACNPPPVQPVCFLAVSSTHWRVRLEPHSLADVAHRSQADMAFTPRDLGFAPVYLSRRSMYSLVAGWLSFSSNGTIAVLM